MTQGLNANNDSDKENIFLCNNLTRKKKRKLRQKLMMQKIDNIIT